MPKTRDTQFNWAGTYILKNGRPVREYSPWKWAEWFATHERRIARLEIGRVTVSTVFLGISSLPPLRLYETMVFGGPLHVSQERYRTLAQARSGHRRWEQKVIDAEIVNHRYFAGRRRRRLTFQALLRALDLCERREGATARELGTVLGCPSHDAYWRLSQCLQHYHSKFRLVGEPARPRPGVHGNTRIYRLKEAVCR